MSTNQNIVKTTEPICDPSVARFLFSPNDPELCNRQFSAPDLPRTIIEMPAAQLLRGPDRRLPACRSESVLEDAFYWLVAAPVLAYLGFLVFSL
jgi:hypothetical protein